MSGKVYQILYCSRNNMQGTEAEIRLQLAGILRASRRNNARVGVTGALFYNSVFFAQVLEGAFVEVQRIFERLQMDPRHCDLVVLQSGYRSSRDFGDWSMAYAGTSADFQLPFHTPDAVPAHGTENGGRVLSFLRDVVVKQENWALPERRSVVRPIASAAEPALVA